MRVILPFPSNQNQQPGQQQTQNIQTQSSSSSQLNPQNNQTLSGVDSTRTSNTSLDRCSSESENATYFEGTVVKDSELKCHVPWGERKPAALTPSPKSKAYAKLETESSFTVPIRDSSHPRQSCINSSSNTESTVSGAASEAAAITLESLCGTVWTKAACVALPSAGKHQHLGVEKDAKEGISQGKFAAKKDPDKPRRISGKKRTQFSDTSLQLPNRKKIESDKMGIVKKPSSELLLVRNRSGSSSSSEGSTIRTSRDGDIAIQDSRINHTGASTSRSTSSRRMRTSYHVDIQTIHREGPADNVEFDPCENPAEVNHNERKKKDPNSDVEFEYNESLLNFEKELKKNGLELVIQEGDGNCLFRAVSLQVFGDSNNHTEVRRRCLDFMKREEAHYSQFVTGEPFCDYIERKSRNGVHGNNPEIQAISELYNRPVEVYVPENGPKPLNIFHKEYTTSDVPIRLSYHDGNHYNAVIDPYRPTAGLGLGLPGLQPGLADDMQMKKAVNESNYLHLKMEMEEAKEKSHMEEIKQAIRESKKNADVNSIYKEKALAMSDVEATNFELEKAVIESSLSSYYDSEVGRKQSSGKTSRERGLDVGRGITSSSTGASRGVASNVASAVSSNAAAASSTSTSLSASFPLSDVASSHGSSNEPVGGLTRDEYPETVQEFVVNGFELPKVIRAYELVGDNFDEMLAILMSSGV